MLDKMWPFLVQHAQMGPCRATADGDYYINGWPRLPSDAPETYWTPREHYGRCGWNCLCCRAFNTENFWHTVNKFTLPREFTACFLCQHRAVRIRRQERKSSHVLMFPCALAWKCQIRSCVQHSAGVAVNLCINSTTHLPVLVEKSVPTIRASDLRAPILPSFWRLIRNILLIVFINTPSPSP